MCGRYTLHQKVDVLAKHYNLAKMPVDTHENYNVAPGQIMPVIIKDENGPKLELMKWGLIPAWAKDPIIGYKLINAREDSIFDKPLWRNLVLRKRALIPADGFYEWKKPAERRGHKQPYYIHPKQVGLFSFAGVWEAWKDVGGKEWKTYSIITTEPNKEMADVHDRMPVILLPDGEADWLGPSNDDQGVLEPLLRPYKDHGLYIHKVSDDVNTTNNNYQNLIYRLNG
jgi:putative SOS response-associated peptidase YedK